MKSKHIKLYLPIVVLALLTLVLAKGLQYDPRTLPSAKLGKPVPSFNLPILGQDKAPAFTPQSMRGQVWVLNVFASWCAACVQEASSLILFKQQNSVPLIGLAYKDAPVDTQQWLAKFGNPYQQVVTDMAGNVGIDLGVYGVPETYVIDAQGIIRYRHVGPVDNQFYQQHVLPIINAQTSLKRAMPAPSNSAAAVKQTAPRLNILTDAEIEARVKALAEELRCLVCQNQTIADSNAALAVDLKRQIAEKIRIGQTDEEIKAYMLERYGEFILYDPPFNYKNLLLWLLPFVVLGIAAIVAFRAQRQVVDAVAETTDLSKQANDIEAMYQAAKRDK
jgi:cytochrome c biogenesis protein CcmG, thiol:disulfide interchange protein DsbE